MPEEKRELHRTIIHWRNLVSNETVRALAGQAPASSLAARRQVLDMVICFASHSIILLRAILDFDPGSFGWKRPRGAPRTHWIDVVRLDLDQLGLDPSIIEPLALIRDKWQALVSLVGSTHDTLRGAVHEIRS